MLSRFFSSFIFLVVTLPAIAEGPATNPSSAASIQIVFDAQPVEQGLTFDRTHAQTSTLTLHGQSINTWEALSGSEPSSQNLRTFRFKITDPRFQSGKMPVADVEFTYYTTGMMGVTAKADTADGAKVIGGGHGRNTDLLTMTCPLQDAFFGGRQLADDEKPLLNGTDLLVSTHNNDLQLRSVRIIGYDRQNNIDWAHMLRIQGVTSAGPGGVLLFPHTSLSQIHFTLKNDALVDRPLRYQFQINDYQDKVQAHSDGALTIPGDKAYDLAVPFDAKTWPLGPYEARLDVFLDNDSKTPFLSQTVQIGLIDDAQLDKARAGEFLYGLDPANGSEYYTHTPLAMAYYRAMGIDLLRDLWEKDTKMTPDDAGVALADLAKEGVQSAILIVPPYDRNPDKMARNLVAVNSSITELAKRYAGTGPGKLHFWEMGNEPDLHFFFGGSMTDYLTAFYSMRQAVKDGAAQAGLKDKDTVVYNGGLAFVHPEGGRRSRELISLLDPTRIDALAYHGHGPGISAERNAWQRVHDELVKDNKAGLTQIETESGVMGTDRQGSLEQARTVVEKIVYAQSQNEPTLMFFRLFMGGGESAYSMTENLVEPRPSVLAYRAMVERLRHFRFVKALDFTGKSKISDADGFLFAEQDADGHWTGRKAVVAFCEKPHSADARVRMALAGVTCQPITLYDMFGNSSPVANVISNVAPLTLGLDPVYLTWSSPNPPDTVDATPAPIQISSLEPLIEGTTTTARFTISNPTQQPVDATLTFESTARIPVHVAPATRSLSLPVGQSVSVPVTFTTETGNQPLSLPKYWSVFLDADPACAASLTTIPSSLAGKNGAIPARQASAPDNQIDFARLANGLAQKRPALACAYLDSPSPATLHCSATADWWMAWYVNGQKVCDTLDAGNQGTDHAFDMPLHAGRNLIVVEVLAGKLGWQLNYSGPKELAAAAGHDPDQLQVTVTADNTTLAQQTFPLQLQPLLPTLAMGEKPDQLETWRPLEPLVVMGSSSIKNLWFQEPDQSRWYKGDMDLSATAWLRDDGTDLQLYVAVTDDKLIQATTAADLSKSDSLRVVLAGDNDKSVLDLTCGLVANQTATQGDLQGATCHVTRHDADSQTLYLITIPKSLVGTNPFHVNLSVADNDEGYLKQTLEAGDVSHPQNGWRVKSN